MGSYNTRFHVQVTIRISICVTVPLTWCFLVDEDLLRKERRNRWMTTKNIEQMPRWCRWQHTGFVIRTCKFDSCTRLNSPLWCQWLTHMHGTHETRVRFPPTASWIRSCSLMEEYVTTNHKIQVRALAGPTRPYRPNRIGCDLPKVMIEVQVLVGSTSVM